MWLSIVREIYITGGTTATSGFPITKDYKTTSGGNSLGAFRDTDVFVVKYNSSGNLLWSTRMGGKNYDRAYALEVDDSGNVYVAGRAGDGFKTTSGAFQTGFGGDAPAARNAGYGYQDGFVLKLDANSGTLKWSTYFGASDSGFIRDIDVDAKGIVHIAATNMSITSGQPITGDAMQANVKGSVDALYAQLSSDGSRLLYGSFLGGNDSGADEVNPSIIVDSAGDINITFFTNATNLPVTPGSYQTRLAGGTDAAVIKLAGETICVNTIMQNNEPLSSTFCRDIRAIIA